LFVQGRGTELQTLLNLLASVALLVWGTHIVRTGVLRVFGSDLRRVLSRSVATRGSAFLAGMGVTGLVQSSSATALITSSFVSQNLIALPRSTCRGSRRCSYSSAWCSSFRAATRRWASSAASPSAWA